MVHSDLSKEMTLKLNLKGEESSDVKGDRRGFAEEKVNRAEILRTDMVQKGLETEGKLVWLVGGKKIRTK